MAGSSPAMTGLAAQVEDGTADEFNVLRLNDGPRRLVM
jgi:hypothetical protein